MPVGPFAPESKTGVPKIAERGAPGRFTLPLIRIDGPALRAPRFCVRRKAGESKAPFILYIYFCEFRFSPFAHVLFDIQNNRTYKTNTRRFERAACWARRGPGDRTLVKMQLKRRGRDRVNRPAHDRTLQPWELERNTDVHNQSPSYPSPPCRLGPDALDSGRDQRAGAGEGNPHRLGDLQSRQPRAE